MKLTHPKGFSLTEILIAVAVIGVIALLSMPFILNSFSEKTIQEQSQPVSVDIQKAFDLERTTGGLISVQNSPASILSSHLNAVDSTSVAANSAATTACDTEFPGMKYTLKSGYNLYDSNE